MGEPGIAEEQAPELVTISQVADAVGVSTATVSRCLNRPEAVRASTLKRVRAKIRELGYHHPEPARRRGPRVQGQDSQHKSLMFLWTGSGSPSRTATGQLLLHGVMAGLRRHSMSLIVDQLGEDGDLPTAITAGAVRGLCLLGSEPASEIVTALRGLPAVWIFQAGAHAWGDRVQPDHRGLGVQAFAYLRSLGAENLCCMTLPASLPIPFHTSRADAFVQQATLTAGVDCRVLEMTTTGTMDSAAWHRTVEETARRFLELRPRPDGLFVAHNLGDPLCDQLRREGVALGRDLHVVVGDSDEVFLGPPLPVARANIVPEEVGAIAADMLLWRIDHPRSPRITHLVCPHIVPPPA